MLLSGCYRLVAYGNFRLQLGDINGAPRIHIPGTEKFCIQQDTEWPNIKLFFGVDPVIVGATPRMAS